MQARLLFVALFCAGTASMAQPNISAWQLNTTGTMASYWDTPGPQLITMTDSGGVIRLCYTTSSVYISTNNLAGNYTMGPANNPNDPGAQNYIFKIPKTPSQQTGSQTAVPTGGAVGLAVNGVVFYGNRSADSYNTNTNTNNGTGGNVWHCDAWYNEKNTMDTSGNGHSDGAKKYHYHANPSTLYTDPSTAHSPIIGYAIDGYPVYGPFGYSVAMNSASTIKRMTSSYQLRSITTRTTLPDGSTASQVGPAVSGTFPLGMYVEDFEYVSGLGDLDTLNGRYCVTPEYPTGTYAYFLATDNTGTPAYPYMFASYYYGVISPGDAGPNVGNATLPSSGLTCVSGSSGIGTLANNERVLVYPNPVADRIHVVMKQDQFNKCVITDVLGKEIYSAKLSSVEETISVRDLQNGAYFIRLSDEQNNIEVIRFVKE